jgi:hypothetical protein
VVAGGRATAGLLLPLVPGGRIAVQDPDADEFLVVRGEEVAYRDALPGGEARRGARAARDVDRRVPARGPREGAARGRRARGVVGRAALFPVGAVW